MYNLRAVFARGKEVKFISHLDMMRVFERALRRSHIPVSYSCGFNPRPKLVFGLPLAVGVTSEGEYVDIVLDEEMKNDVFMEKMNGSLPAGLKILKVSPVEGKGNIMSSIQGALYDLIVSIQFGKTEEYIKQSIKKLISQDEITVEKRTRKKVGIIDIKPMILDIGVKILSESGFKELEFGYNSNMSYFPDKLAKEKYSDLFESCEGTVLIFSLLVRAGSRGNLKPELFAEALKSVLGQDINICEIHRRKLFAD